MQRSPAESPIAYVLKAERAERAEHAERAEGPAEFVL